MLFKLLGLLLCIAVVADAEFVNTVKCEDNTIYSQNVRMEVSGCTSSHERCPLYRGTNHMVKFIFEPTLEFKNTTDSRVYGVFEKFSVPYGQKKNACAHSVTTDDATPCTAMSGFEVGREYMYTSQFSVSNSYPLLSLKVKFVFYDRRTRKQLLCELVNVQITNPEENTVES